MMPTQQSIVMKRKVQVVVERERAEDDNGENNGDNNNVGKGEASAKTTMTTVSNVHVGGGPIDTTIKK